MLFTKNKITKITLPDSITVIGLNSFTKNEITEVIIPPNVVTIESYAFAENQIETLVLNDGLKEIHGRAFSVNKLTSISIPASVTTIGESTPGIEPTTAYERFPFAYNPQLTSVTMGSGNVELSDFFLAENNNFKVSYTAGGAGTYIGSVYGKWEKE